MKDLAWFTALKSLTMSRAGRDGCVSMTTGLIAKRMGCTSQTVKRHLSRLEKENLVKSEKVQLSGCIQETRWTWRAKKPKFEIELTSQIEMNIQ